MRMLLVDDEPGMRMTLAANFELEGFDVVAVENGEQALKVAGESDFDVVLTDIRMPGMSGVDLFEKLRPLRPHMPVVLMTAFAAENRVRDAVDGGAYAVLSKPFRIDVATKALTRAVTAPTVLVIDDSPSDAEAMATMLRSTGLSVKAVHTGEAAVEAVKAGSIDVCILDLVMPGLSGNTLMQKLMKEVEGGVNIIGVSGHAVPELMHQMANSGAQGFLRKPFQPKELVRLIARVRGLGLQKI